MQNTDLLQAEVDKIQQRIIDLSQEYASIGDEIAQLRTRRLEMQVKQFEAYVGEGDPVAAYKTDGAFRQRVIIASWNDAWAHNLLNDVFKSYGRFFYEHARFNRDDSGRDVTQIGPRLMMHKDDDEEAVAFAIEDTTPFCLVPEFDDVFIDIFEHTLSEYGSYHMTFNPSTGVANLDKVTYGHLETMLTAPLRGVLTVIREDHYYE